MLICSWVKAEFSRLSVEIFIDSVSKSTSLTVAVSCAWIVKERAENKERALKFLVSGEFQKRESVYDSFRELGDGFKETYEKLLTQARSQKLVSFKEKLSELSNSKQTSDSFENDFQAWKDAASSGVKLVMTKWKEKDEENFKQNIGAMNDAVKSAEDRYQVLSKAFKGQQFEENDALNNFVDLC